MESCPLEHHLSFPVAFLDARIILFSCREATGEADHNVDGKQYLEGRC